MGKYEDIKWFVNNGLRWSCLWLLITVKPLWLLGEVIVFNAFCVALYLANKGDTRIIGAKPAIVLIAFGVYHIGIALCPLISRRCRAIVIKDKSRFERAVGGLFDLLFIGVILLVYGIYLLASSLI